MSKIIRNKISLNIVLVLVLFSGADLVNALSLTQSIDKTEMAFEDSAKFEITVEWPGPQFAYRFINPLNPYFDRLKIGRFSSSITSTGKGQDEYTTKKFSYILLPTSGGLGKIDPITISYITWPDSVSGELVTEPVSISIAEQKVRAKSTRLPFWIPIAGGILLLGSGAAIYAARSRAAKRRPAAKSPSELALEELSKLKSEAGGDLKKFQTGLYNILMKFLKLKYGLNLAGQSEDKMFELLSGTSLPEPRQKNIVGWLKQAEQDKFRPIEASPGETVRLETELRRFLETLK